MQIPNIIKLMRPHQWYKNLVVFLPIIFSNNLFNLDLLYLSIAAFLITIALSSAGYIVNDIVDADRDKLHPEKRNRPIASGKINKLLGAAFAAVLASLALAGSYLISINLLYASVIFFSLMFLYTYFLKNIFIVDVITISISVVLRAIIGAIAISVMPSVWLMVLTFLIALILGLAKRKGEIALLGSGSKDHRSNLEHYTNPITNILLTIAFGSIYISYIIYSITVRDALMVATLPFATFVIFKYIWYITESPKTLASPEKVMYDPTVLLGIIIWLISVLIVLYH